MDHLHYRLNFDLDKSICTHKYIYAREIDSPIGCWGINFQFVIQNDWKLQISQGYIIRILQHFATKLWYITNFVMLVQAVMKFLSRPKFSL
jgi:hypothetical protein